MSPKTHLVEPILRCKMQPSEYWSQHRRTNCIGYDLILHWPYDGAKDQDIILCNSCGSQIVLYDRCAIYRELYKALAPALLDDKLLSYLLLGRSFGHDVRWVVATYFEKDWAFEHRNLAQARWHELENLTTLEDVDELSQKVNEYDPYCRHFSDCWYSVQQAALVQHVDQFLEHFGG